MIVNNSIDESSFRTDFTVEEFKDLAQQAKSLDWLYSTLDSMVLTQEQNELFKKHLGQQIALLYNLSTEGKFKASLNKLSPEAEHDIAIKTIVDGL